MADTNQAHGGIGATVRFEAADKSGMTLDELDQVVRRARAIEIPGSATVHAISTAMGNQAVRKLEIRG